MGNSENKEQQQVQQGTQEQIVDQNFANQIVLTAFSTLQSIKYQLQHKTGIKPQEKKYGYYDKVDYSQKTLQQLKNQLVIQVESFRASKIKFTQKYGKKYTLPNGFNEKNFIDQCKSYKKFFKECKEQDCYSVVEDMEKIYKDSFKKLSIDDQKKWSFNPETQYTKSYKEQLIKKGAYSANEVQKERNLLKEKSINDPSEIPVQIRRK